MTKEILTISQSDVYLRMNGIDPSTVETEVLALLQEQLTVTPCEISSNNPVAKRLNGTGVELENNKELFI